MTWSTDYTTPGWTEPTPRTVHSLDCGTTRRKPCDCWLSVASPEEQDEITAAMVRRAWRGVGYMSERGVTRGNSREAEDHTDTHPYRGCCTVAFPCSRHAAERVSVTADNSRRAEDSP